MKNVIKTLMVCLVVTAALSIMCSVAGAQLALPATTSQPLVLPSATTGNMGIVIDNFEYWDSPYNHGWIQLEPAYPVYGYGQGYATIFNTIVDFQLGSRVLDVYCAPSVFLIGGSGQYAKHTVTLDVTNKVAALAATNPAISTKTLTSYPILTFDYRASMAIESWETFTFSVVVGTQPTSCGQAPTCTGVPSNTLVIVVRPIEPPYNMQCTNCDYIAYFADQTMSVIYVDIGRGYLDGSWHTVWLNLMDVLSMAYQGAGVTTAPPQDTIYTIGASGQAWRMDNIVFRSPQVLLGQPYLFKIGPRYGQLFQPERFLFVANDPLGLASLLFIDPNGMAPGTATYTAPALITDPTAIAAYWTGLGANPDYFYTPGDPNTQGLDTNGDGAPDVDPNVANALGRNLLVDPTLPVIGDLTLANQLSAALQNKSLVWNATVGSIGQNATQFFQVSPLPINPYDGMPTYLPVYDRSGNFTLQFGKSYLGPQYVTVLEAVLWNLGVTVWPNVAYIDYTPQVFEDLIMTMEVSNGVSSDMETFPLAVVNYPVENHPPYIEDTDDRIFRVDQANYYAVGATDPDCFIFSFPVGTQQAANSHPTLFSGQYRTDMDELTWSLTLNGQPSYQYGPWNEVTIDAHNGLVSFTPKFEGVLDAMLFTQDARGGTSARGFSIFAVQPGTWLNHPPIILSDFEHPIIGTAGEELILTSPTINIQDPDGDKVYYATTLGSIGLSCGQQVIWKFQTNFPGYYQGEIVAYDIRGGYAIVSMDVEIKPWWSFSTANALGL